MKPKQIDNTLSELLSIVFSAKAIDEYLTVKELEKKEGKTFPDYHPNVSTSTKWLKIASKFNSLNNSEVMAMSREKRKELLRQPTIKALLSHLN